MLETNATSLEALLAQVALGNREAFDALYRGTANRLFGICLRVLTERSEAEDACRTCSPPSGAKPHNSMPPARVRPRGSP